MHIPVSTYRIQFSSEFTFANFKEIIDYLEKLGISTIYASPIFKAREGSTHGYDVVDPSCLNPEIGTLAEFEEIQVVLKEKGMTWLQDIVPNHMAYSLENGWIWDMLEFGTRSEYYHFYDVNWDYKNWQKILLPFLGESLENILKENELILKLSSNGFTLNYYENQFPASDASYVSILGMAGFTKWENKFNEFSGRKEEWTELKNEMFTYFSENEQMKTFLNEVKTNPAEMELLLEMQNYKPVHWQHTESEINYRRFFTINDLICLRMEDEKVFTTYHSFIQKMVKKGYFTGLRIDHIDGLYDPKKYLENLSTLLNGDHYVIVEKILEWEEKLPTSWNCEGTSGYEFLAETNHLFTDSSKAEKFSNGYLQIFPKQQEYEDLVYEKKLYILKQRMGGELHNLLSRFEKLNLFQFSDTSAVQKYKTNLSLVLAGFPVYRIYPDKYPLKDSEKEIIETAFNKASQRKESDQEILQELKTIFLGTAEYSKSEMLSLLKRIQQFTGPLAAKGVEDTSFYIFNRLISHNEVGDSPENFGITVSNFHQRMLERFQNFPFSLNTTATHDTKRGEDARMRLNVLSEIPEEWFEKVQEWRNITAQFKSAKNIPDANEEYFIYQALIGAWNFEEETDNFIARTRDYLQKVLREAKVHSSWSEPDEDYESAIFNYISSIIESKEFKISFIPFVKKIAYYGVIKSLSQVVLKCTAPGIPDIYQGSELWELSYVDPDNRRPVNYGLRNNFLTNVKRGKDDNLKYNFNRKNRKYIDGEIKYYVLSTILNFRKNNSLLFLEGEYLPLTVEGINSNSIIAFARKFEDQITIVILPALVVNLFENENFIFHNKNLKIHMDFDQDSEFENIFTGKKFSLNQEDLVYENLNDFPVAVLANKI